MVTSPSCAIITSISPAPTGCQAPSLHGWQSGEPGSTGSTGGRKNGGAGVGGLLGPRAAGAGVLEIPSVSPQRKPEPPLTRGRDTCVLTRKVSGPFSVCPASCSGNCWPILQGKWLLFPRRSSSPRFSGTAWAGAGEMSVRGGSKAYDSPAMEHAAHPE